MSANRLATTINKLDQFPKFSRITLKSRVLGSVVKFFGTAGIRVHELSTERAVMVMPNKRKVQNHIGTVHAAAMSLLAESCTGMLLGMSLPDSKLPLMKSMSFKYVKLAAKGELTAVASLTQEQLHKIANDERGEVEVAVKITDVAGNEPVICTMLWAWISKKPKN